jgi:putative Holliday junction resolvase
MRRGVRLAVDVGSVRVGVARSDPDGVLAVPVETVRRGVGDLARLAELVTEHQALEVVVGLPRTLRGAEGAAAGDARGFAQALAAMVEVPVRMVDERLSTVVAGQGLAAAGRSAKSGRAVVDQAAAVAFLQTALDAERTGTGLPGEVVVPVVEPDSA